MNGTTFVEYIRDLSGEGYDDIEMIRLINSVIYDVNSRGIAGLEFLPLHSESIEQYPEILEEHSIECLLKQREREIITIIPDGVVGRIKLMEEDYNSYSAYNDIYETTIQRYKTTFVMVDMNGNSCSDYIYDSPDNFMCTCSGVSDTSDHVHTIKQVSVVNNREYIKAMAKGEYKNDNIVDNSPSAILHRNWRR